MISTVPKHDTTSQFNFHNTTCIHLVLEVNNTNRAMQWSVDKDADITNWGGGQEPDQEYSK